MDHLTHQLELAHKAMREIQEEKDKMEIEISNHRNLYNSQETNQEGLQRMVQQLEQDKAFMAQQVQDFKIESEALRQQREFDMQKMQDLEMVIQHER